MQSSYRWLLVGFFVFAFLASLASTASGGDSKSSTTGKPTFQFVKPPLQQDELEDEVIGIFEDNCAFAGCHAGTAAPRNLDLTEEAFKAGLVNVKSADVPRFMRVKPGDAKSSYLVMKLLGASNIKGDRMPRGASPLSDDDLAVIVKWINSLPADIKVEAPQREYAQAFHGWTLANLPTAETMETGSFLYRIAHRFKSPVSDGFDRLFGLDGGAFMMTQLAFPLANNFSVTVERSAINSTFEFGGKLRLLREKTDGSVPFSVAIYAGVDWATLAEIPDPVQPEAGNLSRTDRERFAFFAQLPITKQLGSKLSLAAVPGILLNGNVQVDGEDPLVTLGLAGRFAFNQTYSLFSEIVPILSGDETAATVGGRRIADDGTLVFNDTFTAGLEIKAGGHVFHFFVANSAGNTTNQYMSGGDFDFLDGDYRLGFNIYRILNYPFQ